MNLIIKHRGLQRVVVGTSALGTLHLGLSFLVPAHIRAPRYMPEFEQPVLARMRHECNIAATRCGMLLRTHIRAIADYLTFHADEPTTCTYFTEFQRTERNLVTLPSWIKFYIENIHKLIVNGRIPLNANILRIVNSLFLSYKSFTFKKILPTLNV